MGDKGWCSQGLVRSRGGGGQVVGSRGGGSRGWSDGRWWGSRGGMVGGRGDGSQGVGW